MKYFGSGLQKQTLPTFLPAIGLRLTPLSLQVDEFAFYVFFLLCHVSAQTNMDGKVLASKCSAGRSWKYDMACASLLIGAGAKTYPLTYSESLLLKWIPLVPFPIEDKSQMFVGISLFYCPLWKCHYCQFCDDLATCPEGTRDSRQLSAVIGSSPLQNFKGCAAIDGWMDYIICQVPIDQNQTPTGALQIYR